MSVFNIEGSGGAIEYACAQVKVAPSLIVPLSDNGTQFEIVEKDQRIKELESTTLELQSELARKKYSLTVACNRVEELEDKLKIAVEALRRLAKSGDGTHPGWHASFYDCLPTLQIEFSERKQLAAEALEQLGELK